MSNALVVREARFPHSRKIIRAAQYVRMSTDHQRYSIENQITVIGAYADLHNLAIVSVCKRSGLKVVYCAEQFENDGSLTSNMLKSLKRVMAAEFSRELSAKIFAAQCRITSLGFRHGGPITFGLVRELVDENRCSRGYLAAGQRKALQTDRVVVRPGPPDELEVIRSIFRRFVLKRTPRPGLRATSIEKVKTTADNHGLLT
jgi:DNA invertase Pin-like site-specific DNA recombinase